MVNRSSLPGKSLKQLQEINLKGGANSSRVAELTFQIRREWYFQLKLKKLDIPLGARRIEYFVEGDHP